MAGLIKAVLSLEHGMIPRNINFESVNPDIDLEGWGLKVPLKMTPWPLEGLRRASVNCFGFGGTNAHVILDESPRGRLPLPATNGVAKVNGNHKAPEVNGNHKTPEVNGDHKAPEVNGAKIHGADEDTEADIPFHKRDPFVLPFSSHEKGGVRRIIASHAARLREEAANSTSADFLRDYAYTMACRRSALEWRSFITARTASELVEKLESFDDAVVRRSVADKTPRVAFIFCGQGAQWAEMGKDLMSYAAYQESVIAASDFLQTKLSAPFSIREEMEKNTFSTQIYKPELSQPATTILQVALVDLLAACGIRPNKVVGHSSGEIAAAYAAGALTREAAWTVAYYRGVAASHVPEKDPSYDGTMMAAGLSDADARLFISINGPGVEVACINSPRSVTLAGQKSAIAKVQEQLAAAKIFNTMLSVGVAYHSSQMRSVEDEYRSALKGLTATDTRDGITMFSSVTGEAIEGHRLGADYWVQNMLSQVRFMDAVQAMMAHKAPDIVIEVSPATPLKTPLHDIVAALPKKHDFAYLPSIDRRKSAGTAILDVFGESWARGYPVDMAQIVTRGASDLKLQVIPNLPAYPWNHTKSYWHESHLGSAARFRNYGRQDLVGAPTPDSVPFEPRWRGFLRVSESPWIQDHQVQKTIVYPAAGMIVMAIEAAQQIVHDTTRLAGFEFAKVHFERAMIVPSTAHGLEVAVSLRVDTKHDEASESVLHDFAIYSKPLDGSWSRHAHGTLRIQYSDRPARFLRSRRAEYENIQGDSQEALIPRHLYELLDIVGMNYGPLFQNITEVSKGVNCCISKVRVPDTASKMPSNFEFPHLIHPATLDAMFHTLFGIDHDQSMVPVYVERLSISSATPRDVGHEFSGFATVEKTGLRGATASIVMSDASLETTYVDIDGLYLTALATAAPEEGGFLSNNRNLCTEITWEEIVWPEVSEAWDWLRYSPVVIVLPEFHTGSTYYKLSQVLISSLMLYKITAIPATLQEAAEKIDGKAYIFITGAFPKHNLVYDWTEEEFGYFHKIQSKTKALLYVTNSANMESTNLKASAAIGLTRTLRSEDPQKAITTLDLGMNPNDQIVGAVGSIVRIFGKSIVEGAADEARETEYAERDGKLFVPRLRVVEDLSAMIEGTWKDDQVAEKEFAASSSPNISMRVVEAGLSDKSFSFVEEEPFGDLLPHEVEIQFLGAALLPSDVDTVMGRSTEKTIGLDYYGHVTAVGSKVDGVSVNDCVVALIPDGGTLRNRVRVYHKLVTALTEESGNSTLDVLRSTHVAAYYAFHTIGRLSKDKTVFIHAGASAYGQAAVLVAQAMHAEVFVGISGKTWQAQEETLSHVYGIDPDHMINTDSARFVEQLWFATGGRGVDIVFNSTQDYVDANFRCVRKREL